MASSQTPFIEIKQLVKRYRHSGSFFFSPQKEITVVDEAVLNIYRGECLALVGESGSGKTTLGRCLVRLSSPESGQIFHNGIDLLRLNEKQFKPYRRKFQIIFQNPLQALNPRQSIRSCVSEPLKVYHKLSKEALQLRIGELLEQCGLPVELLSRFPHELSGGQRQRVAIARALAMQPLFLIADEPTSSLDAHSRFQIIQLLKQLKQQNHLTLLLITHDLGTVAAIADRICVMYRGKIIETAPTQTLLISPKHPYTQLLIESSKIGCNVKSTDLKCSSSC